MNFVVIEDKQLNMDTNSFEEEYLNSDIMNEELRVKYGLSKLEFRNITQQIKKKMGITRRPNLSAKYYYENNNAWVINRRFDGVLYYYGRIPFHMGFDMLLEALRICEENDWEFETCSHLIKELKKCNC